MIIIASALPPSYSDDAVSTIHYTCHLGMQLAITWHETPDKYSTAM